MKSRRLLVALTALLSMLGAPARADLAGGIAAYEAKDFPAALASFRDQARVGNAEAQFRLGVMFEHGQGVEANHTMAWSWYKRAADANHVGAQRKLAEFYESGRGVPTSLAEAYKWYKRAAERGDVGSKTRVGLANLHGRGKKANFLEGVRWLKAAAEDGDAEARKILADLAAKGAVRRSSQGES